MQAQALTRQSAFEQWARVAAIAVLAAAGALTCVLAGRTYWYLFHSVTNVPYSDQWVMLEEIQRFRAGQSGWSYLWSPYWGQRILLPRLLFFLSATSFHYRILPFIVVNAGAQLALAGVLIATARSLFASSRLLLGAAAVAVAHLLLSSLQMEELVLGMAINYTLGYASAVAAICVMGSAMDRESEGRFWIAIALGLIATSCLAIGTLVWPVLLLGVFISARRENRRIAILVAILLLVAAAYAVHYSRPEGGMGFVGIVLHPLSALYVVTVVLGGPISLYSRTLGAVAGGLGLAVAGGMIVLLWRRREFDGAAARLMLVACFMIGSAASLAAGRYTAEWLATYQGQLLPGRYLVPTFIFWAALLGVALTFWSAGLAGRIGTLAVSVVVAILTFGTWNWQWRIPTAWASISDAYDAIASGFILPVSDQEYMSRILEDAPARGRIVAYMRQERLSVFDEPRASWVGRDVSAIAADVRGANCSATLRENVSLGGSPPVSRIVGALMVNGRPTRQRLDVLIADSEGTVEGLARTLPAQSEGRAATDFFGYTRHPEGRPLSRLVILLPGQRSCAVAMPGAGTSGDGH